MENHEKVPAHARIAINIVWMLGTHNYVDKCETALLVRRMWTIPLVAISGLVVLVVTLASAIASARESLVPHRDTA